MARIMTLVGGLIGTAGMLLVDWSLWPSFRTILAAIMIPGYAVIAISGAVGLARSRR